MDAEAKRLQQAFRRLEGVDAETLADVKDPILGNLTSDGQTIRETIQDLIDEYHRRREQVLWAKWGQAIPRSESRRLVADLQAARADFAAYLMDLDDTQIAKKTSQAEDESATEIAESLLELDRKIMKKLDEAIAKPATKAAPKETNKSDGREAGPEMKEFLARLESQRREATQFLSTLTDKQLGLLWDPQGRSTQEEAPWTVRRLIHRITTHHQDHVHHLLKVREKLGVPLSETAMAVAEAQAARALLTACLAGLTDAELHRDVSEGNELGNMYQREAGDEGYTIKRIIEHVMEMEKMRLGHMHEALDKA